MHVSLLFLPYTHVNCLAMDLFMQRVDSAVLVVHSGVTTFPNEDGVMQVLRCEVFSVVSYYTWIHDASYFTVCKIKGKEAQK